MLRLYGRGREGAQGPGVGNVASERCTTRSAHAFTWSWKMSSGESPGWAESTFTSERTLPVRKMM